MKNKKTKLNMMSTFLLVGFIPLISVAIITLVISVIELVSVLSVTEKEKLDEWKLLETIDAWFDTEKQKELALVKNPEEVYGFGK